MKTKIASTRLSRKDAKLLDDLASLEGLDRAALLRRLVHLGLDVYRETVAVHAYAREKMSLGRAAELAGVTQGEMLGILEKHHTELNYDVKDLENDVRTLHSL